MKALGITCGIGSMLIGARSAGFEIIGNIEWRKYYHYKDEQGRNTFTKNFSPAFMVHTISEVEQPKGIDLAMAHTECGGYSLLNQQRKQSQNDAGDIPLFTELIRRIRPRFFVHDNLPKSLLGYSIQDWHEALPGYDLFPEWISNYNYGNIQKFRRRFFMIGALKKEQFIFHPGEFEHSTTVWDRIGDLHPYRKNTDPNHTRRKPSDKLLTLPSSSMGRVGEFARTMKSMKAGEAPDYRSQSGEMKKRIGTIKAYQYKHSHTLTKGEAVFHPITGFPLTCRERARIQGCPDTFQFYYPGNNLVMTQQTGKFMPVEFCIYIARQISAHIEGKDFLHSGQRIIKSNVLIDEAKQWYCKNAGYYPRKSYQKEVCEACWLPCKR